MPIEQWYLSENINNTLELTPEEILIYQNELEELLTSINSSDIENKKYDSLIRWKKLDDIFQVIFWYKMELNKNDLLKFQSYLYIINRDEYQNINYENIRKVSTNKLIVRWKDGKPLWWYLHTDHTVHIIPWDTTTLNKNWRTYILQKINYIDKESWSNKEWFVAQDYLLPMKWNDLIWLNWYLIEHQIDPSYQTKEKLYNKIKSKFNNETYNPQIIKHNQAIYTYLVEKKIESKIEYKSTQEQTKKSVQKHKEETTENHRINQNKVESPEDISANDNIIYPIIESTETYDSPVQDLLLSMKKQINFIFWNDFDWVTKVEYQQWIELWTRKEVINQLNNKLSLLTNGRNPEMFHTDKLNIEKSDTIENIIQKCIDYIYTIWVTTITILSWTISEDKVGIKNKYNEDNSKYLRRIYWHQNVWSQETTKFKSLLARWLIEK